MTLHWDEMFEEQLPRLPPFWDGWGVSIHLRKKTRISIDPYKITWDSEPGTFELWAKPNKIAQGLFFKEFLMGMEHILHSLSEESDENGNLSQKGEELLERVRVSMDKIDPSHLPEYANPHDWFRFCPPIPEEDPENLLRDARKRGTYLDKEELQRYLLYRAERNL